MQVLVTSEPEIIDVVSVTLVSNELELDSEGVAVPQDWKQVFVSIPRDFISDFYGNPHRYLQSELEDYSVVQTRQVMSRLQEPEPF